jgi:predicted nucleic acid-binding protein
MKILPTITTITGSNWKDKIREIRELKIEEIALFPTCLNKEQRKTLYELLKQTSVKRIPFVHLRTDMDVEELEFLAKEYDTAIFNVHSEREYPIPKEWLVKFKELICIENTHTPLDENEVKNFAGICLDVAHLENLRILEPDKYAQQMEIINKFPIKCNHISAIKKEFSFIDEKKRKLAYDSHFMDNVFELDYLKNYPVKYFSEYCAIELENSISDQLEAIEYINRILGGRDKFVENMLRS